MGTEQALVRDIRAASREMVRELGFMQSTLAASEHSPSAVHALLEIESGGATTAAELVQLLGLDKSSVSRMLGKLVEAGELKEAGDGADARVKHLVLTAKGRRSVEKINAYAQTQVETAMAHLNPAQQQTVAQGLQAYAAALHACRAGVEANPLAVAAAAPSLSMHGGYLPGMVGRVAEMHAAYYSRHSGFGQFFESKVAAGVAEFAGRLDSPRNGVWLATQGERIVGSVAIDGEDLGGNTAHLRWFILDDGCRGSGMGRRLLGEAVAFCDRRGFDTCELWTFKGLDAARRLYESFGFVLVMEEAGDQWGSRVTEQRFSRKRGAAGRSSAV